MSQRTDKKPTDTTHLVLVVDRSGSMEDIRADMEGGIATLLHEQESEPGKCLVTLTQFDDQYEILADAVPVAELLKYRLVPRGSTALLDAIGRTISHVRDQQRDLAPEQRPSVVFVVVTDGYENASQEWTRDQVMSAVKERADDGWDFTFLGADQDAIQEGRSLGIDPDASLTFDKSAMGSRMAMSSLSASVSRKRRGESRKAAFTDEERRQSSGN